MSGLFGNHIVGFPTRRLKTIVKSVPYYVSLPSNVGLKRNNYIYNLSGIRIEHFSYRGLTQIFFKNYFGIGIALCNSYDTETAWPMLTAHDF